MSNLRLNPDPAAIALDYALADRKTNARSRNRFPMKPLEHSEDSLMVLGFDSDPIVRHRKEPVAASFLRRDMNVRRTLSTIFDRVTQ